jgi:dephospho-CoA kinase
MKFRDFLTENKNSTIVAAFGRFNVPTIGHGLLAKKVVDTAKSVKADHIVYASRTQDAKKNPLDVDTKVKYLKKMFPGINFKAANEDVRTFIEMAAKLSEEGYKNLVMIAGSDRIDEYQKLLDKYNGKDFKFNSIKVVSAGERDPDADGAAGMSGTKMREAAIKGDFKAFRSGIPKTLSDKETKDLMEKVRKIMVKEEFNVDEAFTQILTEGVHDKAIFKAVFLAGGPGSGKDYVLDNTLAGHGMTEINSDKALEFLMDKEGLDKTMPASENEKKDIVRGRAKNITELRQRLALLGRNGLIINGTGDDVEKITKIKKKLEEIGYDSSMVVVNTADEVSKQRNIERGQRGGRTVPENIRKEKWDNVQAGRAEFAKMFGPNYMEFDNSEDLRTAPPEVVKAKKEEMLQLFTNVKNFVAAKPTSDVAKEWIAGELDKKDTLKVPKGGAEKVAHPDSGAAEEARKLGLQYYGFGRYGQKGVVTHRSVHDSLVEIPKDKPKETTVPISGSSMRKPEPKKVNEDFEQLFEEDDIEILSEEKEKKVKLLKGHTGKTKVFLLRRSAAKESHIHGGTVMKHPNGYVIKIKEENDNVYETNKLIETETKDSRSSTGSTRTSSSTGTSSGARTGSISEASSEEGASEKSSTKITLAEIRKRKEAQIKESIDMGIEPGISMAASGENLRSTVRKKRIEELTGDETTLSNSAQVEDELKRKGINLKSFKASRYGSF